MHYSDGNLTVRTMTHEEVALAVDWAAAEGWNPGRNDAECFYCTDPDGFFIGEIDGRPVGCISAVSYGPSFGFLGFFIVKPEFRGHRIGTVIGRKALESLGNRNVGLDGVLDKVHNYLHYGFTLAYRNIRHQGTAGEGTATPPTVVETTTLSLNDVSVYDRTCFPAERKRFLERWLSQSGISSYAVVRKGTIRGYGVIRPCRQGWKIGPLFADTETIAEDLFRALTARISGETFYLDIPEVNPAARALVERHRMTEVFATARMYSKERPPLPLDRIFGVTSFELG